MKETIRLFKAVSITTKKKKQPSKELLAQTIKRGFVFAPEVVANYSNLNELIDLIEKEVGLTPEKLNSSFHKSWLKIKEANIEDLVIEQLAHYLTTYGKESPNEYIEEKGEQWRVEDLGERIEALEDFDLSRASDEDYIYIPKEALKIPDIDLEAIKLVVIKGYTKKELKTKLLKLLGSGIALKEDTIKDVVEVALFVGVGVEEVESIKNKEIRTVLYDYLGLIPKNAVEFLRYCVYQSTEETLLIKNEVLFKAIKGVKNLKTISLFERYGEENGLEKLAEVFYRFKPIFLAFRTNSRLKKIINKIRRLAHKYHKPMLEDYLNNVTAIIKGGGLDENKLKEELKKVNIFRKIRLAYALKFRTTEAKSILYRVRNGKGYGTSFEFGYQLLAQKALDLVLDSIIADIGGNVKGKPICRPSYITLF